MQPEPDPRVADLADRYSAGAPGYLETYAPELLPFTSRLFSMLEPLGAARVLDLGAGTGLSASLLRSRAPTATVVLTDRSAGMLALAPVEERRVTADAVALPFDDASFDVVIAAFMLFHLPDPSAGCLEVARILSPEGRVGIATWGTQERLGAAWSVWDEELDRAGAPTLDPHGLPHFQSLGSPELLGPPLEAAGFGHMTFETGWWHYRPTHDASMAFMAKHAYAERLRELSAERRRACIDEIARRTRTLPPEQLGLDDSVVLAVAAR